MITRFSNVIEKCLKFGCPLQVMEIINEVYIGEDKYVYDKEVTNYFLWLMINLGIIVYRR